MRLSDYMIGELNRDICELGSAETEGFLVLIGETVDGNDPMYMEWVERGVAETLEQANQFNPNPLSIIGIVRCTDFKAWEIEDSIREDRLNPLKGWHARTHEVQEVVEMVRKRMAGPKTTETWSILADDEPADFGCPCNEHWMLT